MEEKQAGVDTGIKAKSTAQEVFAYYAGKRKLNQGDIPEEKTRFPEEKKPSS